MSNKSKPKWQRAKVTRAGQCALVWVRVGPPKLGMREEAVDHGGGMGPEPGEAVQARYQTNVRCPEADNRFCWVAAYETELLPEFAASVGYQSCAEFRAGVRADESGE